MNASNFQSDIRPLNAALREAVDFVHAEAMALRSRGGGAGRDEEKQGGAWRCQAGRGKARQGRAGRGERGVVGGEGRGVAGRGK